MVRRVRTREMGIGRFSHDHHHDLVSNHHVRSENQKKMGQGEAGGKEGKVKGGREGKEEEEE